MAQFNADINLTVQIDKALAGVRKIEQRIAAIQNRTIEFKVERQRDISNEIDRLSGSFRRLGSIVKGLTAAGGLGSLAVIFRDLQNVRGIGGAVSTALGPIQGLTNALGSFTESAVQAAAASPGLAAGLTAASVAALAFAPQIARATTDVLKLAKAGAQARVPIQNLLSLLGAASNTLGQESFGDAARFVEQYRQALYESSESVTNLRRRQDSLQKTLNTYNSSSEVAARIAGKLVDVQARLNEELREQADLLRRASGVNVTELEASKGRKSIETRKRRDAFETQQRGEFAQVDASIERLIQKEAELENARLDARAEKEAERAEKSLRASRNESIKTLERQIAVEERIQNVRSQRIARAASSDAQARQASQVRTEIQGQVNSMRVLAKTGTDVVFNTRLQYQLAQQVGTAMDGVVQDYEKQVAAQKRLNNFLKEGAKIRKSYAQEGAQRRQKRGQFAENLALGAGFPLLFGAGAGSVAGSIAGSFVGTGFGGQILGGAIGQIIDDFTGKTAELGQALQPATADLDTVVAAFGGVNSATGAYIEKLEELGRSEEALVVATQTLADLIGAEGVRALKEFGNDTQRLSDEFAKGMTVMQAALAEFINRTGIFKAIVDRIEFTNLVNQAEKSTDPRITALREERATSDVGETGRINQEIAATQRLINIEKERSLELDKLTQEVGIDKIADLNVQTNVLRAQLALEKSGLDLTTDAGYELAQQVIYAEDYARIQSIINQNLDKQIAKQALANAELTTQLALARLAARRDAALEAAQKRSASTASSAERKAEQAAKKEQRVQASLKSEELRQARVAGQINALKLGRVDAINDELAGLDKLKSLERDLVALNTEDERVQQEKLRTLDLQYDLKKSQLEADKAALEVQRQQQRLSGQQELTGLRTQLEQELGGLQLGTNAFDDLATEQANRYANALREINNQLALQKIALAGAQNDEQRGLIEERIANLNAQKTAYQELLPAIAAAEQQQLLYNEALAQVQGPVNALISGFREVIAGTKSVEQAFADFLTTIADQLAQSAAQMIAQYIALGIARKFAGLDPGGGGSVESFTGGFTSDPSAYSRMGLSAFSNVQYRASGGPVAGGSPYVVGENGPELFVPGRSGMIVPNDAMGGGVNSVVNINISDSGTSVDAKNAGKLGRMIESSTMAILTRERRPGGLLTR